MRSSAAALASRQARARSAPNRLSSLWNTSPCWVVSLAVVFLVTPPQIRPASATTHRSPACVSSWAHSSPASPPPITRASARISRRRGSNVGSWAVFSQMDSTAHHLLGGSMPDLGGNMRTSPGSCL